MAARPTTPVCVRVRISYWVRTRTRVRVVRREGARTLVDPATWAVVARVRSEVAATDVYGVRVVRIEDAPAPGAILKVVEVEGQSQISAPKT